MPIPFEVRGGLTRRRFVTGLVAGGALSGLPGTASAMTALSGSPPAVATPLWNLTVGHSKIEIDRKRLNAPCIGGTVPGPILRWREGETVEITVTNTLKHEATSLHWHGIRLPAEMDGVPGISFEGIEPGASFTYRFKVQQSGTYWYHGHSGMQEAQGLYGAIVIDPAQPSPDPCARDYVVMLSEWTDADPADILSTLKMQSDYYNFRQRTAASLPTEAHKVGGVGAALKDRLAWSKMRMAATDISDVSGVIYSYLINGQAPDTNWLGLFQPGERVRLRFINAAAMTFFDVRIPGLEMLVVQADGNAVEPVPVDEFRIGVAETYDVIVQPKEHKAYTIFAQSEDRTGFARGTLAPNEGMSAPIPPMDPRPVRTMVDMGMSMTVIPPGADQHGMGTTTPMDMPDMDMSGMDMAEHDMAGMDMEPKHAQPQPQAQPAIEIDDPGPPPLNVENQYRAAMPLDRLSSPGDGLEHNGRRVLNYTQLRATRPGRDLRPPTREIILHLTGNMERYIWGFNGRKFSESGPIRLKHNERVRFTLINDTMMEHPIHLHGLWSELENGQGDYRPYKHTLISQPGSRLSYLVTADAPGMWAYHCHLMLHMDQGMFRTVIVA